MTQDRHLAFGPFRLDPAKKQLWRDEQVIPLQPRPLAVLEYLALRFGQTVTKEELLAQVWADTYVTKTSLKVCIRAIRQALNDDASQPRYLETVGWEGYRFLGPLHTLAVAHGAESAAQHSALGMQHPLLVGRETELARLNERLAQAVHGERQLVFVTGEAGIGKTTLVEAFVAGVWKQIVAREEERQKVKSKKHKAKIPRDTPTPHVQPLAPRLWLGRGQCVEHYGEGEAYLPVLEALGRLCRGPEGAHVVTVLAQYAPTWLVQMPALVSETDLDTLQRRVQGATRERMLREMAEALEALTAEQGLVLVLEDLHWSDRSTLDLLAAVAQRREPARLFVLATYRPTDVVIHEHPIKGMKQTLQARGHCEELCLELLAEGEVQTYLTQRLAPQPVPDGLARQIYQRTDGQPLFMANVVEHYLQQGNLDENEVPANVQQLIAQQLTRLSAEEQRALEAASVAGYEFPVASVAVALKDDAEAVEERCEELARQGQFLQEAGTVEWPDGTLSGCYRFRHALYQQVLYQRIAPARQVRWHRVIGECSEGAYGARAREIAAELALHFERGRDAGRAVMYLRHAAENAVQRFAHAEAIATLQHALTQVPFLPAPEQESLQLKIYLQLAFSLSVLGRFREILTLLLPQRETIERRQESAIAGPYYFRLGLTYSYLGEQEQAADAADRAVWHAQQCGDVTTMGQAHYVLALRGYWMGEPAAGTLHGRQAIRLLSGTTEHNWLGLSQWILGLNYLFLGEPAPALAAEAEAARLADELQDPRLQSFAAWSIGWIQAAHGEWEDGIARCQHGVACAPDPVSVAAAASALGYAYLEAGDTHHAIIRLEEALAQLLQLRLRQSEGRIRAWLSDAYLLDGRSDEAHELATRSLAINREVKAQYGIAWAQRVLGKIARTKTSFTEAESHFIAALQTFTAMTARFEMGRTHLLLAELAHASGNCTAATAHLRDAWHLFAALPVQKYVEWAEQMAEKWGVLLCEPPLTLP